MTRTLRCLTALGSGLVLVALGVVVPAHFRAVDARVIVAARNAPSLLEAGLALANQGKPGPARMLLRAAQREQVPDAPKLQAALDASAQAHPELQRLGGADPLLEPFFKSRASALPSPPILDLLLVREERQTLLDFLGQSPRPAIPRLLAIRALTNTVRFPPVSSASGQALDAAILLTALLVQGNHLAPPLRDRIDWLAKEARWGEMQNLELVFLDFLTLGKRLNWVQLTDFLRDIDDTATLQKLANAAAEAEDSLPVLYAAVHLSENPAAVAQALGKLGPTATADLGFSLRHGKGGLRALLASQKRIYHPNEKALAVLRLDGLSAFLTRLAQNSWALALVLKLILLLDGAYLLALAGVYALATNGANGFLSGPQLIFTAILLGFTLLFSEPFLMQPQPNAQFPLYWQFPMVEGPVRAAVEKTVQPMNVDTLSLVSLSIFLLLQIVIYIFCRRKLGEIQRQAVPGKLKLKLLENEEHLFDAGLYFGFVGTVLSLVCVSLGVIKPSLMAAYSSTSFGIIFVSILKIFYLRPYRKQLILETEAPAE